jgi:hypothetical protein
MLRSSTTRNGFNVGAGDERVCLRMRKFDCGNLGTVDLAPQIYLEWW